MNPDKEQAITFKCRRIGEAPHIASAAPPDIRTHFLSLVTGSLFSAADSLCKYDTMLAGLGWQGLDDAQVGDNRDDLVETEAGTRQQFAVFVHCPRLPAG